MTLMKRIIIEIISNFIQKQENPIFIMYSRNEFPDKSDAHLIQNKQTCELVFLNRFDGTVNSKYVRPFFNYMLNETFGFKA